MLNSLEVVIGIFLVELAVLLFLSKSVVRSFGQFLLKVTKSHQATVYILSFLFLPGTILHELSHALVAGILLVPVGEIDIFPKIEGDHIRLGSAQVAQTDMLRRMMIGLAPVMVGLAIILSGLWIFQDNLLGPGELWPKLLILYLVFEIANSMFSSKKDLEGALAFFGSIFLAILLIIAVLYWFNLLPNLDFVSKFNSSIISFLKKINLFLLIPIGINLAIALLAKTVNKRFL